MNNSAGHPQAPFPGYRPQPGGQNGYPVPQNVVSPHPLSSPMQQGYQPLPHQALGHVMYNSGSASEFLPPTNYYNTVTWMNHYGANQGGPGVLAHQAAASNMNTTARPQMFYHTVNSNQFPHHVPTNAAPVTHPGHHLVNPPQQLPPRPMQATPQATLTNANMAPDARRSEQKPAGNGRRSGGTYQTIANQSMLPEHMRNNADQTAGPSNQAPNQVNNGGPSPQFMPPENVNVQTSSQTARGSIAPQNTQRTQHPTRFCLPRNPQPAPQTVHNGTVSQHGLDHSIPQGGSLLPRSSVPRPATNHPATNTNAKRAADRPLEQNTAKRQKISASVSPAQQCSPAQRDPQPVANASQVTLGHHDRSTETASRVTPGHHDRPTPAQTAEPEHLPEAELYKIETGFVIEPDASRPSPRNRSVMKWDECIASIHQILLKYEPGEITRELAKLQELCDAVEIFVARPGRRALLTKELEQLLTVRYARIIEEGIALTELDLWHRRDWDTAPAEKKEKVVREAWEKREWERREAGPTKQEVERQMLKRYGIPGNPNRAAWWI